MRAIKNKRKDVIVPGDVYVGRGSPLGNPYTHKGSRQDTMVKATRAEAIEAYDGWLRAAIAAGDKRVIAALDAIPEGAALVCYCRPLACHAEVIARVLEERRAYPVFIRAAGNCVCPACGKEYWRHAYDRRWLDWDGNPYLNKLCDGTLVKL